MEHEAYKIVERDVENDLVVIYAVCPDRILCVSMDGIVSSVPRGTLDVDQYSGTRTAA